MDSIVTLKSKTGIVKLPKTVGSAVSLQDGTNVQDFANNITSQITNHSHNDLYYLKQEVADLIDSRINALNIENTYSKSELDIILNAKAAKIHTHTEYYTKEEIDALLQNYQQKENNIEE